MANLTKEQKLDMVSKAIDAGFEISVNHHEIKTAEELEEAVLVFDGITDQQYWGSQESQIGWLWVNNEIKNYDDRFSGTIHFGTLRGADDAT